MSDKLACVRGRDIYLRPMTTGDQERVIQWLYQTDPYGQSPDVFHYLPQENFSRVFSDHEGHFIIMTKEHDAAGHIRYFNVNFRNRSSEVGCLLNPSFVNMGYATEAMRLILNLLFDEFGMNKVHAQTGAFNQRAGRLFERLGFRNEGVLREHYFHRGSFHDAHVFGILVSEWQKLRDSVLTQPGGVMQA